MIDINHEAGEWNLAEASRLLKESRQAVIDALALPDNIYISYLLTDNKKISELNFKFRGESKATNVLSWPSISLEPWTVEYPFTPLSISEVEIGDIAFSYEVISEEAQAAHLPLKDHFFHLSLHGLLHLVGFDHLNEHQACYMESLEVKILEKFGKHNPYDIFQPTI